jgi:hypothetical protein
MTEGFVNRRPKVGRSTHRGSDGHGIGSDSDPSGLKEGHSLLATSNVYRTGGLAAMHPPLSTYESRGNAGAFDLPDRLSAKADPALIAADEHHFAAISQSLEQQSADLSDRLAVERKAPGGTGQQAMDRDLEIHRRIRARTQAGTSSTRITRRETTFSVAVSTPSAPRPAIVSATWASRVGSIRPSPPGTAAARLTVRHRSAPAVRCGTVRSRRT